MFLGYFLTNFDFCNSKTVFCSLLVACLLVACFIRLNAFKPFFVRVGRFVVVRCLVGQKNKLCEQVTTF